MKKIFVVLFVFICGISSLFSQEKVENEKSSVEVKFSTEISTGFLNGSISEYVMDNYCYNNHMSQLDWDIKKINVTDFKADIEIAKYFFVSANVMAGFPKQSGFMQDYDWLNPYYWPDDPIEELTNYSKHTNYLTKYIKTSESIGVNLCLPLGITISPFVTYEAEKIAFDGKDGYYSYKSKNFEDVAMSGKVISYEQQTKMLFFSLALDFAPVSFVEFKIASGISPKLTKIDAIDRHIITGNAYWDHLYKATAYKGFAELVLGTERMKFGISGDVYYVPEITGYTSSARLNKDGELKSKFAGKIGEGGSNRFLYDIMLTLKINF